MHVNITRDNLRKQNMEKLAIMCDFELGFYYSTVQEWTSYSNGCCPFLIKADNYDNVIIFIKIYIYIYSNKSSGYR